MFELKEKEEGLVFKAFVLPKSSKNMISGVHNEALKVKLTAPPVDGAANKLCIKFLSKALKVSKSSLEIITGHTGRNKMILIKLDNDTDKGERKRLKELFSTFINK